MADERRLKQILLNLLSNAIKFTPEGGRITLTVIGDERNEVVQVTVADTGIGIAEDKIQTLFKPFVQLDSRLSRQYEGTGLGLALVDQLVQLHGGTIRVVSQLQRGSDFIICLPWKVAARDVSAAPILAPPLVVSNSRSDSPLILLAEDNAMNREMLVEFLEFLGYQILIATNGAEAVKQAKQHIPDLVLMDVQMPILDGLQATRQLRADPRTKDLTIIALTGLAMLGDRERVMAAKVDDYLTKPVSLKLLQDTIEARLDHVPLML